MLEIAIAGSTSFPVGYVETWDMYPMDFIEFLYAIGVNQNHLNMIKDAFSNTLDIPELLHDKFNDFFTSYVICGGMPEVVAMYVKTNSYVETLKVQRRIVSDYKNDMIKYGTANEKIKVQECYSSVPLQLAKENKKFQYKLVQKGYNARYYDASLRWLEQSGMILKVNRLSHIMQPLEAAVELNIFKVYVADTGLLISQLDESMIQKIVLGDLETYKGMLYENIGVQILAAAEYKAFYYEPNTRSEIDFITYYNHEITPIEVKAGFKTKSKSFENFVKNHKSEIGFRFSKKNIGRHDNIYHLPYYLMPFLLGGEIAISDK